MFDDALSLKNNRKNHIKKHFKCNSAAATTLTTNYFKKYKKKQVLFQEKRKIVTNFHTKTPIKHLKNTYRDTEKSSHFNVKFI